MESAGLPGQLESQRIQESLTLNPDSSLKSKSPKTLKQNQKPIPNTCQTKNVNAQSKKQTIS